MDQTYPRKAYPSVTEMTSAAPAIDQKSNPNIAPIHPSTPHGPDWWLMMKAFLRQGRKIASFAPSSKYMARKIIDGIDWKQAKCIVELGAGTGPITAEVIK